MIYPIINYSSFGEPVSFVERNIAIDSSVGAVSDGILFLVGLPGTKFLIDQHGRLYYSANGPVRTDYYSGRAEYVGDDIVRYDYSGKIDSIGSHYLYYDSYSGKISRIGDNIFIYDSYSGLLDRVGGIYFYYEYDYGSSKNRVSKVADCYFYYESGRLSKITYYTLPSSYTKEWLAETVREGTLYIYYEYSGKIKKIGDTYF